MNEQLLLLDQAVQREKQERAARELYEQEQRLRAVLLGSSYSQSPLAEEERVRIPVKKKGGGGSSFCFCGGSSKKHIDGLLAQRASSLGVICCHPWGPVGGSMYDPNVVYVLNSFKSCTTLRFNFRSGIDFGITAANDLRDAIDYMLSAIESPPQRVLLVGYSYGSLVVADVAPEHDQVVAFAMLMPPLGVKSFLMGPPLLREDPTERARASPKPKLMVIGTHDQFCTRERFERWANTLQQPARSVVMQGPLVEERGCGGCGHDHDHGHGESLVERRQPVDHFNAFPFLEETFAPWVQLAFGCPLEELGDSDGYAKQV